MSTLILLKSPSPGLLKALCFRDFSHQTLGVFFNARKSIIFVDHFLKNKGHGCSGKWFLDSMKILKLHILQIYKRRLRQRQIVWNFKVKNRSTSKDISNLYLENLYEIEADHLLFARDVLDHGDNCFFEMNSLSPRLLDDQFFCDLSDPI